MCCCRKPTVNGQPGCQMTPDSKPGTYPPNPPEVEDGDEILYDLPGRCGGIDSHSYHYRLVKQYGNVQLLVKHGGGQEKIPHLSNAERVVDALSLLGPNEDLRYWLLNALYHAQADAGRKARAETNLYWQQAAAEKRIRVRKVRGWNTYQVTVAPPKTQEQT